MNQINQLFFQELVEFLTENIKINTEDKNLLDLISKTYYSYIIYLDKLIDHEIELNENSLTENPLFNLTENHELCIKTLIKLFGEGSSIFQSKSKYSKIYFDTLIKEKLINFDQTFTKEQFREIAINKHIPVFFIVDGVKILNDQYPTEAIKTMLSHIFVGIQMYDDITDMGEDLINKQSTYIISKTIEFLKSDNDYYSDNTSYTHKAFFALEELCNPEFDCILKEFEQAKIIAQENKLHKIENWIEAISNQVIDWKLQIEEIRNA